MHPSKNKVTKWVKHYVAEINRDSEESFRIVPMCAHGKVECIFSMVVVTMLTIAEFESNDHRKDSPHFNTIDFISGNFINFPKSLFYGTHIF